VSVLLSSFATHYSLHYKLHSPTPCASSWWSGATATVSVATKWGRSRPLRCFAGVQNQRSREAQPQCSVPFPFTADVNGTVNRSVNRVFHAPFTFPRQEKATNPFPRTSIRNGFTRPTGDFNVSSPLYTKRLSREENLTENLCDLPFFFLGPAHSEAPSSSSGGRVCNASLARSPCTFAGSK
jgi:hypothetical protein